MREHGFRAMILAAGRGERMRPLTDHLPKPLLAVGGKSLLVWHLERLKAAGFAEVVINHAHLGQLIEQALGDGQAFGLRICYSAEPPGALETAGGIRHALPLLGDQPFLVLNGDVWCDWPLTQAVEWLRSDWAESEARVLLAPNPPQHPHGDFALDDQGRLSLDKALPRHTFTGCACYHPRLFAPLTDGEPARLAPILSEKITQGRIQGSIYSGRWHDIGTPQRLKELDLALRGHDGVQSRPNPS